MKCRVDFILVEDGRPLCELSAVGDTMEGAIASAMLAAAPHLADGRQAVVVHAGFLCLCGNYHSVAEIIALNQHGGEGGEESKAAMGAPN